MILSIALAWLTILGICWLGWQFLRQNGRLLLRLEELEKRLDEMEFGAGEERAGLTVGSEAPAFELPDLAGERKSLAQYQGQSLLLIFFNPACGYCRDLAPKLAAFSEGSTGHWPVPPGDSPGEIAGVLQSFKDATSQADPADVPFGESPNGAGGSPALPRLLILTTGDTEKNRRFFAEHKVGCPVLLQNDGEVAKSYQVNGTPTGYLVSADGKVASELAVGAEALLKLASQPVPLTPSDREKEKTGSNDRASSFGNRSLARSKIKRDGLKAGTPAPDFRLPRLDGRGELSLEEFRGRRVLLVFSSPHCGPCAALAPELEKFHRQQRATEHPLTLTLSPAGGERESANGITVVMISKGEPKENRAKVKEHGLTFPVVLQQQWEISRRYAMFSTPIAYLIDEHGILAADVAVGVEPILTLLLNGQARERELALL